MHACNDKGLLLKISASCSRQVLRFKWIILSQLDRFSGIWFVWRKETHPNSELSGKGEEVGRGGGLGGLSYSQTPLQLV
jgi:hypothetical protein